MSMLTCHRGPVGAKPQAIGVAVPPVLLDADGKAAGNYETIEVPLPAACNCGATAATVRVGYFPRRPGVPGTPENLPGWRAEAIIRRQANFRVLPRAAIDVLGRSAACRERAQAVTDAVEGLANSLVDAGDDCRGRARKWCNAVAAALGDWVADFEKQAHKETTTMVVHEKPPKILSTKECRGLLEDFRRSYESCAQAFLELGRQAEAIRDQEAYAEHCGTFDEWIKSEGFGHSFVYDCMKAARIYRLMAPSAEPKRIVLDCESHYRDIPADVTPKEAKAIAAKLEELVEPGEDGARKPTRREVKAAVAAVRPRAEEGEKGRKEKGEIPAADPFSPSPPLPFSPSSPPRLAPETITGEYVEVVGNSPDCAQGLAALPLVDAETPPTWMAELTCARANLARWLQRWEACDEFRYEAQRMLEDLAVDVKTRTLGGSLRTPARRAK